MYSAGTILSLSETDKKNIAKEYVMHIANRGDGTCLVQDATGDFKIIAKELLFTIYADARINGLRKQIERLKAEVNNLRSDTRRKVTMSKTKRQIELEGQMRSLQTDVAYLAGESLYETIEAMYELQKEIKMSIPDDIKEIAGIAREYEKSKTKEIELCEHHIYQISELKKTSKLYNK